jgi:hypothetical protein
VTDQDALTAALTARHKLLTGAAVVEVDIASAGGGSYKTRYTPANRAALESYIQELQSRIAGTVTRGAIGFAL